MMKKKFLLLLFISIIAIGAIVFVMQQDKEEAILLDILSTKNGTIEIYTYRGIDPDELPAEMVYSNIAIYENESELAALADLIVLGSVETTLDQDKSYFQRSKHTNSITAFYSVSSFRVDEVLYGAYDKKYLNIVQSSAIGKNEVGDICKFSKENGVDLDKNDTYIIYLKHVNEHYTEVLGADTYSTLSLYHSIINLSEIAPKSRTGDTHYDTRIASIRQGVLERFSSELKAEGVFVAE